MNNAKSGNPLPCRRSWALPASIMAMGRRCGAITVSIGLVKKNWVGAITVKVIIVSHKSHS